MMGTYAIIEIDSGLVTNTIVWDGIAEFAPIEGCLLIETSTASIGWTYVNGEFLPPPIQPPTPAQVLAAQSAILQSLTQLANAQKTALTNRIATLQDAIDNVGVEGMEEFAATPEEQGEFPKRKAQLTKWKNYGIALGRVTSQAGWYTTVVWPAQPAEGMDLTVSARAPETV
ncbi:tail fiber assembly protein [Pseudomonas sp. G3-19]